MTLDALYNRIDWSQADLAQDQWQEDHTEAPVIQPDKKWRINVLYEALQGLLDLPTPPEVGDRRSDLFQSYDEHDVKKTARYLLHCAGVWDQVITILKDEGLIDD